MSASGPSGVATTQVPSAANILAGQVSHAASAGPTTVVTIPTGRVFVGKAYVSASVANQATTTSIGENIASVSIGGVGAVPGGTVLKVTAFSTSGTATSTQGMAGNNFGYVDLVVYAVGNPATVQFTSGQSGDLHEADCTVIGQLL